MPLDTAALGESVGRRVQVLSRLPRRYQRPTSLISFLPAKAGAGATTLASCVGSAISKAHKTLLIDFDLTAGTAGFRHRANCSHSIADILDNVEHLDETVWAQMVSHCRSLHVLSGRLTREVEVSAAALDSLIEFLRTIYDVVIFDLSGNLEPYAVQIMRACSRVFLVTTQEVDCLHLGRQRAEALREAGLADRVEILMNRVHRSDYLGHTEVGDLLQFPVKAQFPNDYKSVQTSLREGTALNPSSALSTALQRFLPALLEEREAAAPRPRRFLEFVNLSIFSYKHQASLRSERWS